METGANKSKNVFAELASSASIYALALLVTRVTSFVLLPVYTRYLTRAQYGVLDLLDMTMAFCGLLLAVPLSQPMFYFYSREADVDKRRRVVSTTVLGSALMGLGISALVIGLAPWLSQLVFQTTEYAPLMTMTGITLGTNIPFDTALASFRIENSPKLMAVWSVAKAFLQVVLAVGSLVIFGGQLFPLVASGAIACTSMSVALLIYCGRRNGFALDRRLFGTQWRMALPGVLTAGSQFFVNFASRFLLQRLSDLAAVGLYALGYKFGSSVGLIQMAVHSYWSAQVHFLYQQPDKERLINRIFLMFFAAMTLVVAILSVLARPAIRIMAAAEFADAWQLVPWLATGFLVRAAIDFLRALLYVQARFKADARLNVVGAVASAAIMAVLVPAYGALGAAASFLLTQVVILGLVVWQLRSTGDDWISMRSAAWMLLILVAAVSPLYLVGPGTIVQDLLLAAGCLAAFAVTTMITVQPVRDGLVSARRILLDRLA